MADITKLKRRAKGTPPSLTEAPGNTAKQPRDKGESRKPLQVMIPEEDKLAFQIAAKTAGQKDWEFFLTVWNYWQNETS